MVKQFEGRWKIVALAFSSFLLGVALLLLLLNTLGYLPQRSVSTITEKVTEKQVYLESSAEISAVNKVSDSLVRIMPEAKVLSWQTGDLNVINECFDSAKCLSTGLILTSDGLVFVPGDLIQGENLRVVDSLGKAYRFEMLGEYQGAKLLRILKDEGKFFNLQAVGIAYDSDLQVGQKIISVAAVLGKSPLINEGTVEALSTNFVDQYVKFYNGQNNEKLRITANMGGSLFFDYSGRLIAYKTDQLRPAGDLGLLLNRLAKTDKISEQINAGFSCFELNKTLAQKWAIAIDNGCAVTSVGSLAAGQFSEGVDKGSIAEKAGLRTSDIILEIDGLKADSNGLTKKIGEAVTGKKLPLIVFRGGKTVELLMSF